MQRCKISSSSFKLPVLVFFGRMWFDIAQMSDYYAHWWLMFEHYSTVWQRGQLSQGMSSLCWLHIEDRSCPHTRSSCKYKHLITDINVNILSMGSVISVRQSMHETWSPQSHRLWCYLNSLQTIFIYLPICMKCLFVFFCSFCLFVYLPICMRLQVRHSVITASPPSSPPSTSSANPSPSN